MLHWHEQIEASEDTDGVMGVAREFLATWGPEELGRVPADARPTRIKGLDDLTYWHQRLVDCYVLSGASGEGAEEVRELLHFFTIAVLKAGEVGGVPPVDEHDAAARLFSDRSMPKLFTSAMTGGGQ